MKKIKNKKSMSSVVSTIILLFVGIIAISMIYFTINNLVNNVKYSPQFSCSEIKIDNSVNLMSSCYNSSSSEIEVKVRKGFGSGDSKIETMQFIINSNSQTQSSSSEWQCGGLGCGCEIPNDGEIKTYYFKLSQEEINLQNQNSITLKANSECLIATTEIKEC